MNAEQMCPRPLRIEEVAALHREYLEAIEPWVKTAGRIYAVLPPPPVIYNKDMDCWEPVTGLREIPDWARTAMGPIEEILQGIREDFRRRGLR